MNRFFSIVIGNPPYSGISQNRDPWITNLIEDYKYVNGVHFQERKHWLNDDYVKFLRFGQDIISKNNQGIIAFINPHGFLDNPTFRGMRWSLLNFFNRIHTVDLNGNSKKQTNNKLTGIDENVFDITQGVSINFFLRKNTKKNEDVKIFFKNLLGRRDYKYDFLNHHKLNDVSFEEILPVKPFYFFNFFNSDGIEIYDKGFKVNDLFVHFTVGFITANDGLNISFNPNEHREKLNKLIHQDEETWRIDNNRPNDARDWKYEFAKTDYLKNVKKEITQVSYRPFDTRYSLYTGQSRGLYASPQPRIMNTFLNSENIGLVMIRKSRSKSDYREIFITNKILAGATGITSLDINYLFPLYNLDQNLFATNSEVYSEKKSNYNPDIINKISEGLKISFSESKTVTDGEYSPVDLLDYVYCIMYSNKYRKHFEQFLKIDFPRIPYPENKDIFWSLVKLGSELRQLHLLESSTTENFMTSFPVSGSNELPKGPEFKNNRVYINKEQYFDGVSELAWDFFIGGYQPAQKWLKDRKGLILTADDINHYHKIIVALTETDRIMKEIDQIDFMESSSENEYPSQQDDVRIAADSGND